ncbi:MAG: hypothetical protein JO230_31020 [Xanthobacteraceae bacterium]|nr:hypothetical protein [Xanthobacteraceae bacterium]
MFKQSFEHRESNKAQVGHQLTGAVKMISQREVDILTDTIKKHSGLDIPLNAAAEALYAVAEYNYRRISHTPEPHTYVVSDEVSAGPEQRPATEDRPAKIIGLVRAQPRDDALHRSVNDG